MLTDGYRATLPAEPAADLEERLGKVLEPLGVPTSEIHVERVYQPPLPARWSVMLTIGAAVALLSAMTAVAGSAQEIRPRMLLLRVIGFPGGVQRRVLAVQAAVIVGLAMLLGVVGGWLVAGSQLWPQHIPVTLPWPTVLATAFGVTALASAAAAALRPRTDARLRER
ncbi:FtsX-like permease family protein [Kitasatospora phosalacinea]|uniref:FtsX-like permease family protein n=1 Tax=Kitasatospora phosalacinea TaxID=2065 RepID=UPI000525B002|nr:FtsX-like permease family protein [Kitasatospora phosalacinea]